MSEGDTIPAEFDSMIAKLVAWGRDRPEALAAPLRALAETEVVVRRGSTNRAFLLALLDRPEVVAGEVDVGWLERLAATGEHVPRHHLDVALLQAAVEIYDDELGAELAEFFALAARGRAQVRASVGHSVDLSARGSDYHFDVHRLGASLYRVVGAGAEVELRVERSGTFERRVFVRGRTYRVLSVVDGHRHLLEVDGVSHRISRDTGGVVRAPAPSVVVAVLVKPGDEVAAGDRLVVLEAMKTELSVAAPVGGRVADVLVAPNVQVEAAAPLLELQPLEREDTSESDARVDLGALEERQGPEAGAEARCRDVLDALRRQMLGFDVDPRHSSELVARYGKVSRQLAPDDEVLLEGEEEVLTVFADACSLARTRPDPDALPGEEAHSSHEDLLVYLRSIEGRGEGLPTSFLEHLRRALGHYGIDDLEPTAELREALLWLAKARERLGAQLPAIQSLLDRRLEQLERLAPRADEGFRAILDRLIGATQQRFAELSRNAREVRYQYFERPEFEDRAARSYAEAATHLDALEHLADDAAECERRMVALIECPQPLKNYLTRQFEAASAARRRVMLQALTRRYYRIRDLQAFAVVSSRGHDFGLAQYDHEGARIQLITTFARYEGLEQAARAMAPLLADMPDEHEVVVDFYVWRPDPPQDDEATERELRETLGRVAFSRRVRRLVVAIERAGPRPRDGGHAALHLSPSPQGRLPGRCAPPRLSPHDGQAPAPPAAAQLPPGATPVGGGRLPVRRGRERQPRRRATVRPGRGARRHSDAQRDRP